MADFETFVEKLRFDFLAPRDDSPAEDHETIWGRAPPPELRYNMDQVSLPFVNGQDTTFTTDDDVDVNLKCPKESLRNANIQCISFVMQGKGIKHMGCASWYSGARDYELIKVKKRFGIQMLKCFGKTKHGLKVKS